MSDDRSLSEEILYDWISARELRLSAARTLAGFSCEYYERDEPETGSPGVPRCRHGASEREDWCSQCQQRDRLYPSLVAIRKAERLAFARLCRSALRFKKRHDLASSVGARLTDHEAGTACGSATPSSSGKDL